MVMSARRSRVVIALAAAVGLTGVAGCASSVAPSAGDTASKTLTVVTHDSFALSQDLLDQFETETGYTVTYVAPGDAGTVVNQLVLTKDSPLGDVVFGIDNTFAGRALSNDVVVPYATQALSEDDLAPYAADDSHRLTPIDFGDVCVNADTAWFADHDLAVPTTLDDLADPAYADLFVTSNPASSSPGMAFLAATIGAKGDPGYLDYWTELKDNGVLVADDWTEAYTVQFFRILGPGATAARLELFDVPGLRGDGRRLGHDRSAGHLLPSGGIRRGDQRRAERRGRAGVHRLHAEQRRSGGHPRPDVHVSRLARR